MKFNIQKFAFTIVSILFFNQQVNCIIYSAITFRHPKSSQLITLLSDVHIDAADGSYSKKEQEFILQQAKKYNAAVVVEDIMSTIDNCFIFSHRNYPYKVFLKKDGTFITNGLVSSGMSYVAKKCEENKIKVLNLEDDIQLLMEPNFLRVSPLNNSDTCEIIFNALLKAAKQPFFYGQEKEDVFGIIPYRSRSFDIESAVMLFNSLRYENDSPLTLERYISFLYDHSQRAPSSRNENRDFYFDWKIANEKTKIELFTKIDLIRNSFFICNMMRSIYEFRQNPHIIIWAGGVHIDDFLTKLNDAEFVELHAMKGSCEQRISLTLNLTLIDTVNLETYFKQLDEIIIKQSAQSAKAASNASSSASSSSNNSSSSSSSSAGSSSSSAASNSSSSSSSVMHQHSKVNNNCGTREWKRTISNTMSLIVKDDGTMSLHVIVPYTNMKALQENDKEKYLQKFKENAQKKPKNMHPTKAQVVLIHSDGGRIGSYEVDLKLLQQDQQAQQHTTASSNSSLSSSSSSRSSSSSSAGSSFSSASSSSSSAQSKK